MSSQPTKSTETSTPVCLGEVGDVRHEFVFFGLDELPAQHVQLRALLGLPVCALCAWAFVQSSRAGPVSAPAARKRGAAVKHRVG